MNGQMKIEIMINGKKYAAQYNEIKGSHGFNSHDEFYSVYVANERAIERCAHHALDVAREQGDTYSQQLGASATLTTKSGVEISATVYPNK